MSLLSGVESCIPGNGLAVFDALLVAIDVFNAWLVKIIVYQLSHEIGNFDIGCRMQTVGDHNPEFIIFCPRGGGVDVDAAFGQLSEGGFMLIGQPGRIEVECYLTVDR